MSESHVLLRLLTIDGYVTGARTGLSGASTSKAPDNAWLDHVKIFKNIGRNDIFFKCVHRKDTLKRSTTRLYGHVPRSERLSHACRRLQAWFGLSLIWRPKEQTMFKIYIRPHAKGPGRPTNGS